MSRVRSTILQALGALMVLGACVAPTRAQSYQRYTEADGLASNSVQSVMQDRDGFIWIGSEKGLQRFDGVRFTTWIDGNDPEIRNGKAEVRSLVQDAEGKIWAEMGRWFIRLDPGTGEWRYALDEVHPSPGGTQYRPIGLLADHGGRLIVRGKAGMLEVDPHPPHRSTEVLFRRTWEPDGPAMAANAVAEDDLSRLWVAGAFGAGLHVLDRSTGETHEISVRERAYHPDVLAEWQRLEARGSPLAAIRRVESGQDLGVTLVLERPTWVAVRSVGEALSQLEDYGWIESESGTPLWTPQAIGARHPGGAVKNIIEIGTVRLSAGRYRIRYRSDSVHAFDDWNATQPDHPDWWGIVVLEVSEAEARRIASLAALEDSSTWYLPANPHAMVADHSGGVWVSSGAGRITRVEPDLTRTTTIETRKWIQDVSASIGVPQVARGATGMYVGVTIGFDFHAFFETTPSGEVVRQVVEIPHLGSTLHYRLTNLHADRSGVVWAASNGDGLFRIDPAPSPVRVLRSGQAVEGTDVYAFAERPDGLVWLGTSAGLELMDLEAGRPIGPVRRISDQPVRALHLDADGILWIGTESAGLRRLNTRTGSLRAYTYDAIDTGTLSSASVRGILRDQEGRLIVITVDSHWGGGLNVLDESTGAFERLLYRGDSLAVLSGPRLSDARQDAAGRVFLATGTSIDRLEWMDGRYRTHSMVDVPGGAEAIHIEEDGVLLFSPRSGGLVRLDMATGHTERIRGHGQLDAARLDNLVSGPDGSLWAAVGSDSLARIAPDSPGFMLFGDSEGVTLPNLHTQAALRHSSGSILYGGRGGIVVVEPDALGGMYGPPPKVVLTDVRIDDRLAGSPDGESIRVQASETALEIHFAALDYRRPGRTRYRFRLEPQDDHWVEVGAGVPAQYARLRPGSYRFALEGTDVFGRWHAAQPVEIRVMAPLWARWWFLLLATILLVTGVVLAYQARTRHLLRIERMRSRIATDLHDDLGSKLSSIALISEIVADEHLVDPAGKERLGEIAETARGLVEEMREIVWMVSPKYDNLGDLIARMEQVTPTLLAGRRFSIETQGLALGDELSLDVRRHVFLMYKEVLHNVARHSGAERVRIRVRADDGQLRVEVQDDGVGFDPADAEFGTGLDSLQERARAAGGFVQIESAPGEGTRILMVAAVPERSSFHALPFGGPP